MGEQLDRISQALQELFDAMPPVQPTKPPEPEIGDIIYADWPGEYEAEFAIADIRPDVDGVLCVVFGKDGTVGAEAVSSLRWSNNNNRWERGT